MCRGNEIDAWLAERGKNVCYAIIDDTPITGFFTEGQQKHLFVVDEWAGLDEGTAGSVIEYLNGLNKG